MAKTFNKHFVKRLLSSTALIGALFFSNTLSVSAEAINDTQSVEKTPTEEVQGTYEQEKMDTLVETKDDRTIEEDNEKLTVDEDTTEVEDSKKSEEGTKESDSLEISENENQKDFEETDKSLSETEDLSEETDKLEEANRSDIDEESEIEDIELSGDKQSEGIKQEEKVAEEKNLSIDKEKTTESKESEDGELENKEKETEEKTEESKQKFQETLSVADQQFFAPMMANFSSARVTKINDGPVERIEGATRDHIAATISQRGWNSSNVVYLVNGFKEADALTGAPLASTQDAPILFTRDNVLPSVTLNEIKRLGASKVIILGGTTSVPQHIVNTLENSNLSVERINGNNRYDLASNIAKNVMDEEGTQRDAFLVNGDAYADAISIAPVAANKRLPIFLTRANELHSTVKNAIPYINSWTIIGGQLSISNNVIAEMEAAGATIANRFDGNNRYAVNRNIINYYGNDKDYVYVASGEVVSDALATSALAGKENANILLVKDNNVKTLHQQTDFIKDKHNVEEYVIVGGEKTLSKMTENHFVEPLVYVDPGHGGQYDPGTAHYGIVEKELNLSISFKLADRLEDYGYEVVMSRTDDSAVGLYDRPAEANALGADIFVSVHNNAMPGANGSAVHGIETYYYQYDAVDTYKPQYPVGSDAWNKATSQHRDNESKRLAEAIHSELIVDTGAVDRGTKEMGFAVIRETFMPAVLLELGFVSNYNEAQRLNTDSYQNTLADAIVKGINNYFMI